MLLVKSRYQVLFMIKEASAVNKMDKKWNYNREIFGTKTISKCVESRRNENAQHYIVRKWIWYLDELQFILILFIF